MGLSRSKQRKKTSSELVYGTVMSLSAELLMCSINEEPVMHSLMLKLNAYFLSVQDMEEPKNKCSFFSGLDGST